MNNATDTSNDWSGFIANVIATWEWVERFFAALWSGLGWPHAVLIMFCVGVYYFKGEIKSVIPRIKRIGSDGFEVESQSPPVQPTVKDGEVKNIPKGDFPHTFDVALRIVQKDIEGKSDADALQHLIGDDAGWRVLWYFETIYSYIYGGQIRLLQLLNQRGTMGMTLAEVEAEWEEHKSRNKPTMDKWEMQPYLDFLKSRELILLEGDTLKITFTGNEFLTWMAKYGRSDNRLW
ncbi:hypothetical protein PS712_04182 [Pseudomonas fluorescens]|uniref:Uncharacterized protein n=1 Tax=Pseudomonas fluorescens TaxID=294 RepID=A0A5E7DS13_PSEFL|nr:hypothetical protein [Pseudomonas fluorescens]VVO20333.1 hypothetical protein PS712_04182 [Pseudomonas fluorescens]